MTRLFKWRLLWFDEPDMIQRSLANGDEDSCVMDVGDMMKRETEVKVRRGRGVGRKER